MGLLFLPVGSLSCKELPSGPIDSETTQARAAFAAIVAVRISPRCSRDTIRRRINVSAIGILFTARRSWVV